MTAKEVIHELNLLEMFAGTPKAAEAVRIATDAILKQDERENPKPLTLEELRQMDGEPVYSAKKKQWFFVVYHRDSNSTALVDIWETAILPQSAMPLYRQKPKEGSK